MEFYPIHFDQLQSTNNYCINLIAKSNPIEGTVITTYNQVEGHGQIGRKWFSDKDKNITSSIILYPQFLSIDKLFYLNIVLSLAIRSALTKWIKNDLKIKWPNDIYYRDKKLGGLLIQQSIQGKKIVSSVFGYGLNINQIKFPDILPNPVSIYNIIGDTISLEDFQIDILKEVEKYYNRLKNGEFLELRKEYLIHLYGRGEIRTFSVEGDLFKAEIIGVDAQGKLTLNNNGNVESYSLNQISYIIPVS